MEESPDVLDEAVKDPRVIARYFAKITPDPESECWWWTGAISGRGHGRFWIRNGKVVIAQRFGWALAHPGEPVPPVVGHECDNPLCQQPSHLSASTTKKNRAEWDARRHTLGSPLRDTRGARKRAEAIRDAALSGRDIKDAQNAGLPYADRHQLPLW